MDVSSNEVTLSFCLLNMFVEICFDFIGKNQFSAKMYQSYLTNDIDLSGVDTID